MLIGMIRYAVPNAFDGNCSRTIAQLYTNPYFNDRFKIFKEITLQSFINQTCHDFVLLLYHSHLIPEDKKQLFIDLEKEYSFIRNVYVKDRNLIIPNDLKSDKMLTFRIDNDDGIALDFIEKLKSTIENTTDINFAINFPRYYKIKRIEKNKYALVAASIESNSLGLAYYSNDHKTIKALGQHITIKDKCPMTYLKERCGLQIINGYNAANNIKQGEKIEYYTKAEIEDFLFKHNYAKLNLECLPICKEGKT